MTPPAPRPDNPRDMSPSSMSLQERLRALLDLPDEERTIGAFHLKQQLGRGGFAPVTEATGIFPSYIAQAADLNEKPKPLLSRQLVFIAVTSDGNAPHQFHDKERPASFGGAGFEHLGDVRVVH